MNDGSEDVYDAVQSVARGGNATKPSLDPTRTDTYVFDGWYTAASGGTEYDFSSPVNGDLDLYAKWNPPVPLPSLAAAIADMAKMANRPSASYTLPSGNESYDTMVTLTAGTNSPESVTIDGSGRIVTGTTYISLTVGEGVTLTLKNMTFNKIPFKVMAGGTLVLDDGSKIQGNRHHYHNSGSGVSTATGVHDGTGVYVDGGTLEMKTGSLITDNNHSGVQVFGGGSFTMSDGEISGNRIENGRYGGGSAGWDGAGVGINGTDSAFTMTGGEISDNRAHEYYGVGGVGGGVAVSGVDAVFTMSDGKISGNTADYSGGGVKLGSGATFNMRDTAEISGNTAASGSGGGVSMSNNTTFNMAGGVIKSNKAGGEGGGVYATGSGTRFNMTGGTIGGTASDDGNIAGIAPPPTGYVGEGFYGGGVFLGNYVGAHMSGNPRVVSLDGAVNGVLNGVNGQLIEDQIYANPPAYTTNTEVYDLLDRYKGGNGSAIIEGYTDGSGPGLIQNNYPRNVQFTFDTNRNIDVFRDPSGQVIPPATTSEGWGISVPHRYIP
jgi:uncharacterized repeat protein (TIGR02543 family)